MSLVKNKYNIFKDSRPLIEIIFIIKVLILLKESFTWYICLQKSSPEPLRKNNNTNQYKSESLSIVCRFTIV